MLDCTGKVSVVDASSFRPSPSSPSPTVTSELLRESTESTVHGLFTLLGMDYATEGKMAPPFSEIFAALGVNVDMTGATCGSVVVGHTSARKEELSETVDSFLESGCMTAKDAERLGGRLVFFEGFTFGRVAQVAIKHIGRHALGSDGSDKLSADVAWALQMVKLRIKQALPITISSVSLRTSFIFTDLLTILGLARRTLQERSASRP